MRITDHTRDECVVSGDGVCLALGGEEYRHPEAFLGVAGVAGVDVFQVSVSPADLHPVTNVNASVEQGQDNGNGQQAAIREKEFQSLQNINSNGMESAAQTIFARRLLPKRLLPKQVVLLGSAFFQPFCGNERNWIFRNLEFKEKILEFSKKNP